jgi:hypothetical protein
MRNGKSQVGRRGREVDKTVAAKTYVILHKINNKPLLSQLAPVHLPTPKHSSISLLQHIAPLHCPIRDTRYEIHDHSNPPTRQIPHIAARGADTIRPRHTR